MSDAPLLTSDISHEALTALLERHALGQLQTVTQLSGNQDSALLLVNDALVVRLERSASAARDLQMDAVLFRRLRHATDVPCSEVLVYDNRRDIVPFAVLVTRQVEGVPGNTVWPQLDLPTREQISEELGRLCASIHSVYWPVYGSMFASGPIDTRSARWADIVNAKIAAMYHAAEQRAILPLPILDDLVTTLNDGDAVFDTPSSPTLTHSDLAMWNIVLCQQDAQWHVAAIQGWNHALVADAAWEFATFWRNPDEPHPFADSFIHGYKERRPLQDDLRVRQRLYRLMRLFDQLITIAGQPNTPHERMQLLQTTIQRLLKPR